MICPVCMRNEKAKKIDFKYKNHSFYDSKWRIDTKEELVKMLNIARGIMSYKMIDLTYIDAVKVYADIYGGDHLTYDRLADYSLSHGLKKSPESVVIHLVFEMILGINVKCKGCFLSMHHKLLKDGEDIGSVDDLEIRVTEFVEKIHSKASKEHAKLREEEQ